MFELLKYYMSTNLKDYPNIGFDMKICWILLALTVGIICAAILVTVERNNMISLVKKLTRVEANDENSAKTLKELSLDNVVVRLLLKSSGRLKRLVKLVGEKEYTYEEYIALTKKKKKKKGEGVKEESEKSVNKIDFTKARFYLADINSDETKNLTEARKSPIINTVLFCIFLLCLFVCLMFLMPTILSAIDNFLFKNS